MTERSKEKVIRDENGFIRFLNMIPEGCWKDVSWFVSEKDGKRFVEGEVTTVYKKILSVDWFAIISGYRAERSSAENDKKNADLLKDIRQIGLAFTPFKIRGIGQEQVDDSNVDTLEYAWFVFHDIETVKREFKDIKDAARVLRSLAENYEQDCFIVGQAKDGRIYAELWCKESEEWVLAKDYNYATIHFDRFVRETSGDLFCAELKEDRKFLLQRKEGVVECLFWNGNIGFSEKGVMSSLGVYYGSIDYAKLFKDWVRIRDKSDLDKIEMD